MSRSLDTLGGPGICWGSRKEVNERLSRASVWPVARSRRVECHSTTADHGFDRTIEAAGAEALRQEARRRGQTHTHITIVACHFILLLAPG